MNIALWNGGSVVILALGSIFLCLLFGLWSGVIAGIMIGSSGGMELWGRALVKNRRPRARFWMPFSQLWLLGLIIIYCLWQMNRTDLHELNAVVGPLLEASGQLGEAGLDVETMVKLMLRLTYSIIIVVSIFYQGSLAWFYARATKQICPPAMPG